MMTLCYCLEDANSCRPYFGISLIGGTSGVYVTWMHFEFIHSVHV